MASQKITRYLFQILIICLGFGCASYSNEMTYCPKVGVISDLDRVTKIEMAASQSKSNVLLSSKIQRLGTKCKAAADGITISIVFDLFSKLSRYDIPTDVDLRYLIAIIDPNDQILAKQVYKTTVSFMDGIQTTKNTQEAEVFIPSSGNNDFRNHKVLVGFELTEAQLQLNRGIR
tara:strand:+ start:699 stop:1223 length:525 start_codon:yes stop_codon:yes gene_type:complete